MADQDITPFKSCSKCGLSKPANSEHFGTYKDRGKIRQHTFCRECWNARTRAYRAAHPEKAKEWDRQNTIKNKAPSSDYQKRRYARTDKAKAREDLKAWKADNPDKVRKHWERTYAKHKQKHFARSAKWAREKRKSDPAFCAKRNEWTREWCRKNKYHTKRSAKRRKTDVRIRIMDSIRRRVHWALKGQAKSGSVSAMIGASVEDVRKYIEHLFKPGMTWKNWGRGWNGSRQWHLDHIKPLASFDLTDPSQFALACHYTNLQPLWAEDNLRKGGR